jgi:hypothetical protein
VTAMNFEPKDVDAHLDRQRRQTLLHRCGNAVRWIVQRIDKHGPVVTTLATVAIALLTAVYVHYSKKQWKEMHSAGEQTQKLLCLTQQQVAIAKAANDDTHNQLVATQAAIFRLEPSYSQGSSSPISGRTEIPSIDVRVANDGKSAARKIFGQVEYVHRDKAGRIIQSDRRPLADDTMYGNGSAFFKQFIIKPARASLMDYASDTFKVTATITYDDGFNNTRTQRFCSEMAVTLNRAAWVECGEANAWKQTVR